MFGIEGTTECEEILINCAIAFIIVLFRGTQCKLISTTRYRICYKVVLMEQFNKFSSLHINGLRIDEKVGNIIITIEPGTSCTFDPNAPSNGKHFHHCYELCLVTGGLGVFNHGKESIPLSIGDVFIANPNIMHEIGISKVRALPQSNILQLFYFSINIYRGDTQKSKSYEEDILNAFLDSHCIIRNSQHHLLAYLNFVYEYSNCKSSIVFGVRHAIKNIVMESLFSLTENVLSTQANYHLSNNIVDMAIDYIGRNLDNKITLGEISDSCNTSKRNLQYLFRSSLNTTVVDYINARKMSLASSFIRMNFSINDVATKVGINDPAQFCRLFKKYYGIPPKKYQMMYSANGMIFGADYSQSE